MPRDGVPWTWTSGPTPDRHGPVGPVVELVPQVVQRHREEVEFVGLAPPVGSGGVCPRAESGAGVLYGRGGRCAVRHFCPLPERRWTQVREPAVVGTRPESTKYVLPSLPPSGSCGRPAPGRCFSSSRSGVEERHLDVRVCPRSGTRTLSRPSSGTRGPSPPLPRVVTSSHRPPPCLRL